MLGKSEMGLHEPSLEHSVSCPATDSGGWKAEADAGEAGELGSGGGGAAGNWRRALSLQGRQQLPGSAVLWRDSPGLGCVGGAVHCFKVCLTHSWLNLSHILKISFSWAFRS